MSNSLIYGAIKSRDYWQVVQFQQIKLAAASENRRISWTVIYISNYLNQIVLANHYSYLSK